MPLALCPNDLFRGELLTFLDVPNDIGVNAGAFPRQQVTAHVGEQESAEHLEAVYRAEKGWRLLFNCTAYLGKALSPCTANPRYFRINTAQAEVRGKTNPLGRSCML